MFLNYFKQNHPWCRKGNVAGVVNRKVTPPFKPDPFELYFDEVSTQDLMLSLDAEDERNVIEINDFEDGDEGLVGFRYVCQDEKRY